MLVVKGIRVNVIICDQKISIPVYKTRVTSE